jgi:hypothetical protein
VTFADRRGQFQMRLPMEVIEMFGQLKTTGGAGRGR